LSTIQKKDLFLSTLGDILSEQSTTIRTQMPRLRNILEDYWKILKVTLPEIRPVVINKERFLTHPSDLTYRIECVRSLQYAMMDLFFVIKAIAELLFNQYLSSDLISQDFSEQDKVPLSFLISEFFIGALLQFVSIDHSSIPTGFIVIAKNKALMKLKGRTSQQLLDDLEKNGFSSNIQEIDSILCFLTDLGYLSMEEEVTTNENRYKFIKDFKLTPEGEGIFQKKIRPVLDWAIEMWRSVYNVRSIDVIVPDNYPYREFLTETVKRAATQGYETAYNVMENIGNYYEICLNKGFHVP